MGRTSRLAGAALVAITLAAAGGAAVAADAPGIDPTARYDIDDILHRHAHDISNLPTQEAAQGRPITFSADVAGTFATNAGASHSNTVSTGYVTPAFSIDLTPVNAGGWNFGAGTMIDADFYSGQYNNRFGEGRVEGFAFADRKVGPGTLTAEGVYLGVWDNSFSDREFNLWIGDLDYSFKLGPVSTDVSGEYEGSEVPELRRTRLNATLAYTLPQKPLGHEITLEADAYWAHFVAGANNGRNDVTTALVLIAERELGRGWSLEWEGAYVNRLSNRVLSRFDTFDLAVEIAKKF
jgi:hypothetical protein